MLGYYQPGDLGYSQAIWDQTEERRWSQQGATNSIDIDTAEGSSGLLSVDEWVSLPNQQGKSL